MHNHFVGRWVTTILVALATLVSVSAAALFVPLLMGMMIS